MPRPPRRTRRSRAQSRFSAFFHGRSVITPSPIPARKAVPTTPIRTPIFDRYHTSVPRSRSPTSTRSLIDPSSSPLRCDESLPSEVFPGFERASRRLNTSLIPTSRLPADDRDPARTAGYSQHGRAWRRPKKVEKEARHLCFPRIRNPRIRRKVIGCLVSGIILVLVLTICTSIGLTSILPLHLPPPLLHASASPPLIY